MANYCWNDVTIKGKESVITKIKEIFEKYEDTNTFREFGDLFFPDVETFVEDYGTKWWDFSITELNERAINITGDSAWGPPLVLTEMIAAHYDVEVEHTFDEPGMDFAGTYEWAGNELIKDEDMTSVEYNYKDQGVDYIVSNYISCIEDDDAYESFEAFVDSLGITIPDEDLKYLKIEYYKQVKEMLDKKKVIEELKEIEIHLRNLSMESLADKVMRTYDLLEVEWQDEIKENVNEDKTNISEE